MLCFALYDITSRSWKNGGKNAGGLIPVYELGSEHTVSHRRAFKIFSCNISFVLVSRLVDVVVRQPDAVLRISGNS